MIDTSPGGWHLGGKNCREQDGHNLGKISLTDNYSPVPVTMGHLKSLALSVAKRIFT